MKKLILVRHAESSRKDKTLPDLNRPLTEQGTHDAILIASRLRANNLLPTQILSSPALRARTTSQAIARGLGIAEKNILICDEIYLNGVTGLSDALKYILPDANCVCLVGHNPDLTEFAKALLGKAIENIPTSGIVSIELNLSE